MRAFFDFMEAAAPWIGFGILLAVFFARQTGGRKEPGTQKQIEGSGCSALQSSETAGQEHFGEEIPGQSGEPEKSENYGLLGLLVGMSLGSALHQVFGSVNMVNCMLVGFAIGVSIKKKTVPAVQAEQ